MSDETNAVNAETPETVDTATLVDPTPAPQEQSKPMAQPEKASRKDAYVYAMERSGETLPENYKSWGDQYDALTNAQAKMTQATQEAASLRKRLAELEAQVPTQEPTATPEPTEEAEVVPVDENAELFLKPKDENAAPTSEEVAAAGINQDQYDRMKAELSTTGDISEETRAELKKVLGPLTDTILDGVVTAEKARRRDAYKTADTLLGGKGDLAKVFAWAGENYTPEQQAEINASLSGPAWESAVLGLHAQWQRATANAARDAKVDEPKRPKDAANVSSTPSSFPPYKTRTEYYKDMNNPRFNTDPKFRDAVRRRLAASGNPTRLPER